MYKVSTEINVDILVPRPPELFDTEQGYEVPVEDLDEASIERIGEMYAETIRQMAKEKQST